MTGKRSMVEVSFDELMAWREALANCALENNQYAIEQLALWNTNREAFIAEYIRQKEAKNKALHQAQEVREKLDIRPLKVTTMIRQLRRGIKSS